MNEYDEYALEEALAIKRLHGARVTVATLGPVTSTECLSTALARGADEAIRVDDSELERTDSIATSRVLSALIRKLECDLVLTGAQSADTMAGQVGILIAEELGIPHLTAVSKMELDSQGRVEVVRDMGGGITETSEVKLPALLAVISSSHLPTYVPFLSALQQRKTNTKTISIPSVFDDEEYKMKSSTEVVEVFPPTSERNLKLFTGTPAETAAQLTRELRDLGLI